MFHGTHYIGNDILAHFEKGETWRKVFGPIFVYLNSTADVSNAYNIWTDAKKQVPFHSIGLIAPFKYISVTHIWLSRTKHKM
jgi:hypothetical protein